jgi:branched-chain amino acid transport system permease protein
VATLYLNVIAGGILIGIVYALIALGLTIIFGVMRIVNFAHGEMVVIGMYVGYGLWSVTKIPPWMIAPAAALVLFVLGYALQRAIVNSFIDRPQHSQFILFISFALIITGLHLVFFRPGSATDRDDREHAILRHRTSPP